jgi:hypothetical protein
MLSKMHDTLTKGDLQATQALQVTNCSRWTTYSDSVSVQRPRRHREMDLSEALARQTVCGRQRPQPWLGMQLWLRMQWRMQPRMLTVTHRVPRVCFFRDSIVGVGRGPRHGAARGLWLSGPLLGPVGR